MNTRNLLPIKALLLSILCFVSFNSSYAQITWTETYTSTQGNATAAQLAGWDAFRASLIGSLPYSKMKVTGVTGSVINSDSCMDPLMVQDIAMRLRTYTPASPTYTWVDGTRTWRVGNCGVGAELSMNQTICACTNPGRSIRGGCTSCFNNNGAWGFADCGNPTVTFTVEFFYGYPCTSVPTANISGPYQVCQNKPFTLVPDKFYADATYTWEFSNNGTTWQPFPGAVGAFSGGITDNITAPRWYRLTITCIANPTLTYTTPVWKVDLAQFMYCYCDDAAAITTGLDIGNVTILNGSNNATILNNGLSTPSLSNSAANKTYTSFQYSVAPFRLYRDTTYKISVSQISSLATFKNGNVVVFIDYNRDGIFNGSEKILSKTITGSSAVSNTESATFTIPSTAQIGLTGMRVILGAGNVDSCGTITEGEVEDYIVDLSYEPCKGPGNAGTVVSTDYSLCPNYDYVLTNGGYEFKKSELDRLWQVSGDNVLWSNVAGSNNKDQLFKIFTGQPLYYRVRMICPRTNDTTYTPNAKIDPKDGYKCYCFSQSEGGSSDTSDIGGLTISTFSKNSGGAHLLNGTAKQKRSDYTDDVPTTLYADSTYNLIVYHTMRTAEHGDAKVTVFMDFNNDKEYDIPSERVYTGYTSVGNYTLVDNIKIPNTVITDVPTGMRVILNNNIAPNVPSDNACGTYKSGETEDLMIMFRKNFPATISGTGVGISDFGLFPNPTNGKFKLSFTAPSSAKEVSVTISNVTGQQIMKEIYKYDGGQFSKEIDMANSPAGVYFVEIQAGDEIAKKKLVIK